jgi:hypothetical protein
VAVALEEAVLGSLLDPPLQACPETTQARDKETT